MLDAIPLGLRVAAAGLAVLIGTLGLTATASAAPGATHVSGSETTVEKCAGVSGAFGTFAVTGDLEGCWYTDRFDPLAGSPNGLFVGRGLEHFVGCIGTKCGTLSFKFVFIGKFDAGGAELWGACHHPILGGTGDFAGATGELNFTDVPDGTPVPPADYTGRVTLGT